MQSRNKTLLIILGIVGVVVLIASCVAITIGAGLIAWLVPTRVVTSTDISPIVATVPPLSEPFPFSGLSGLPVTGVRVETGVGSPAMVVVVVEGEFSSPCVQVEEIRTRYLAERQIHIEVLSSPDISTCPVANQGLFFLLRIPLNMVEMPSGTYSVIVNGVQVDFNWSDSPSDTQGHFPKFDQPENAGLLPIPLQDAQVEIGIGSPMPVEVVLAGEWPNLCSQLAQVRTQYGDQKFFIDLLATPEDPTCPPDLLGLPFAMRIPLNMVEIPPGTYTVYANGLSTSFDWPPMEEPQGNLLSALRMAYIGPDGNIWLVDLPENVPSMVTNDATPLDSSGPVVLAYNDPKLSSDGRFIAYRRGLATQQENGGSMDFGLWVVDLTTKIADEIYALSPAGYNWKPGTHLLTYVPELEGQYFGIRGATPDPTYAKGIMGYDADSGETFELVRPERGYALAAPIWSPDARFLGFDELLYYEGRGPFAYYDFTNGIYIPWEHPLGMYSWSPDGETLAYDNLTYTPTGDERIFVCSRHGGMESKFSPDSIQGIAILPAFSPQGDKIAYLVNTGGPDNQRFTLFVQPFPQGEPIALGEFENVYLLEWSPDGTRLYFSSGIWGEQWIAEVNLLTGEWVEFSQGMQPDISAIP